MGSFINALVWRLHEQSVKTLKPTRTKKTWLLRSSSDNLSIVHGRSMCPNCRHELSTRDLVPVFSWLALKGKCRYCNKPISLQYPLVELATVLLFIASYLWWPVTLSGAQISIFVLWLALIVGFVALIVYDARWQLLPNRIIYPLGFIAVIMASIEVAIANRPAITTLDLILAVMVGGGIFYVLFQVSGGKWIGGGDVRLGWLLGLVAGTPDRSFLLIFLAAALGSLLSVPLLATKRLKRSSKIPFGPFLIIAVIIVQLFGAGILHWYQRTFIQL